MAKHGTGEDSLMAVAIETNGPPVQSRSMDVAQLATEYHRPLYRYAYRLTGSEADAEDLTQQTFLIAQGKLEQLRDLGKVRSWLFTVLLNCYLKSRRKRTPIPAGNLELDVDTIPEEIPREHDIDQQRLQKAIDDLPDEFKVVLVMFYFDQISYKAIAAELDVPLGTVMSRLSRAKGHLRQRLLSDDS